MNTTEILQKVYEDPVLKQIFIGVYPFNVAPNIDLLPTALILNMDSSDLPGSHWIALFYTKKGECNYFDSFGRKPDSNILAYISKNSKKFIYNNLCVQDLWSISCGQMCLYFLVWRCRGISFKNIVESMLSDDFIAGFIDCL
jgi:hypothetical protein